MAELEGNRASFVNKRVAFRFFRQELIFDLSQSLFSSFDIDHGTRLLLKTIAKEVDLAAINSVLDVGCGVGVLGLALKKVNPALALAVQDRDALALAFTRHNARLNKIEDVETVSGLALHNLAARRFDLILSNLPGKAGPPVLADMVSRMSFHLTEQGRAAVVIVKPLAGHLAQTLRENGAALLYEERAKGHTVFHFRGGKGPAAADPFAPYRRSSPSFRTGGISYTLETVYNLPEFDRLGFGTALALDVIKKEGVNGRILIWNPGQGHLPVYLQRRFRRNITQFTLASRDLLSLIISRKNLVAQEEVAAGVTAVHLPSLLDVTGQYDFILCLPDEDPGVPWPKLLPQHCHRLLLSGGKALVFGRTTFINRLITNIAGLTVIADKKRHGFRTALFVR